MDANVREILTVILIHLLKELLKVVSVMLDGIDGDAPAPPPSDL